MRNATWRKWIVAMAVSLATLAPAARVGATCGLGCGDEIPWLLEAWAALAAPSDLGATTAGGDPSPRKFVLGWSYQFMPGDQSRHRVMPSVDLLFSDSVAGRGRLGYRYARRTAFAGAWIGFDGSRVTASPEIGFKFGHLRSEESNGYDPSLHLLTRTDIVPETGRVRAITILVGWNLF